MFQILKAIIVTILLILYVQYFFKDVIIKYNQQLTSIATTQEVFEGDFSAPGHSTAGHFSAGHLTAGVSTFGHLTAWTFGRLDT